MLDRGLRLEVGHAGGVQPLRPDLRQRRGLGFLGAGTIPLRGEVVWGLTTAASLWAVAAVGLAVGGGLYVAAVAATVIVVVILAGVKPIGEHYRERLHVRPLRLVARSGEMSIDLLQQVSGERSSRIKRLVVRRSVSEGLDEVTVTFVRPSQGSVEVIAERLRAHPGIVSVETDIG